MHVTLTDLLDSHIGNSEKIRILNRLEAVALSDTHARYRQNIVQETKERGNKELTKKFVVLSIHVDNIISKAMQLCIVVINNVAGMAPQYKH